MDESFKHTPTVDALARLVSARITLWQKDKAFNDKRYDSSSRDDSSGAPSKKPRHDENSRQAPILAAATSNYDRCNGCGHPGHIRRNCRYSKFQEFNADGPWEGSASFKKIEARMQKEGTTSSRWSTESRAS